MTTSESSKLPEHLRQLIQANPQQPVEVILRVQTADDATQTRLEDAGLTVRHRLTLVPQFAVTGPGQAILALENEEWLLGIEGDRSVHTWQ